MYQKPRRNYKVERRAQTRHHSLAKNRAPVNKVWKEAIPEIKVSSEPTSPKKFFTDTFLGLLGQGANKSQLDVPGSRQRRSSVSSNASRRGSVSRPPSELKEEKAGLAKMLGSAATKPEKLKKSEPVSRRPSMSLHPSDSDSSAVLDASAILGGALPKLELKKQSTTLSKPSTGAQSLEHSASKAFVSKLANVLNDKIYLTQNIDRKCEVL